MIPRAFIYEWQRNAPWQSNAQIEQDLVISRALVELFSDEMLSENLAFRGGTALNKLYLHPQPRYSEDIDLVQVFAKPFGPIIDRISEKLKFLGKPRKEQKNRNNTLIFHFDSEIQPVQRLKLKVETNCREHFNVMGFHHYPFEVNSPWYRGSCQLTTYRIEELLGTKLRALYQRKKGRDLYDLYRALVSIPHIDKDAIVKCYRTYMDFVVDQQPSQKVFLKNLEEKVQDDEFSGDILGLIRSSEAYNLKDAFELIKDELIVKI